jgi:hypothetical protein
MTDSAAVLNPGTLPHPAAPSPAPKGAASIPKAAIGGERKRKRPVKFPIQMRVNLEQSKYATLQQVCEHEGVPEGIAARIAITEWIGRKILQYRR